MGENLTNNPSEFNPQAIKLKFIRMNSPCKLNQTETDEKEGILHRNHGLKQNPYKIK